MEEIIRELKKHVQGEVRFDKYSRILYSTDASIYQIEPKGVVIPKSAEDVQAVLEIAARHKVPVTPRGGGTSLVGQSIGAGIVVDFSKYMNKILEINREEMWARIQPGVVLDQLNSAAAKSGLVFGPDVATSSRANLGGLMGNNSSGARSIVYGKTIDHVLEMEVLLSDATPVTFSTKTEKAYHALAKGDALVNSIYRNVRQIALNNKAEIIKRYPKILRRVAGYNLDEFVNGESFNLSKMIVGSEGTLAVLTEAKVKLVPKPKEHVLGVIHFNTLFLALEAVCHILEFSPSAVELLDNHVIDATRSTMEYARRLTFVEGKPAALLMVEFQGDAKAELKQKLAKLIDHLKKNKIGYAHVLAIDSSEQENVWAVRKAGLGILLGTKGAKKPIGFVEDTAVPVEHLAEYIREFDKIIKTHQTSACYYAHASVGLLHVRPMLNLNDRQGVADMQSIADAVSGLVLKYGGAYSGEHGDGLARSCFNEKMFGPQLYQAFKEVKRVFDPNNILNPGKIIADQKLTENLRFQTNPQIHEVNTILDFTHEGGFYNAIEMCNGNGVCRKKDSGTMCPSYMATMEEEHSTRGRANALRSALSGKLDLSEFGSKRMYEVMDLCLACKGCKGECPTNVDMAKIKYEFLYHYHKKNGLPLRDRLFGNIAFFNKLGSATAPLSNRILKALPVKWLLHHFLGVDCQRSLPPFAAENFLKWYAQNKSTSSGIKNVVFFNDTFLTYNYPGIGISAVRVLAAMGFDCILPDKKCCGRPYLSKGMLKQARANARFNIEKLYPLVEQGYDIVGCEPSCMLTFRDEYPDLAKDSRALEIAKHTFLIEEFITGQAKHFDLKLNPDQAQNKYLLHGHCHQKAITGMQSTVDMLKMIPQAQVKVVDSGCCGMAGAFGFEKEHYQLSMAIGRSRLFAAIADNTDGWQIVAPGVSCRQQIEHGFRRQAKHPVEVLAEHLL